MNDQDWQQLLNEYLPNTSLEGNSSMTASPNIAGISRANNNLLQQLRVINSMILPTSLEQQRASLATQPAQTAMLSQLYHQFGPQFQATQDAINEQRQHDTAAGNARVANSAEGQLALKAAMDADKTANPEYYATRTATSQSLGDLLKSIDLSGTLTGSQNRAIGQSIAQDGVRTGTVNTPSATQTTANAMNYGDAVYKRQEQAKSDLSGAIAQATSFLPTSQSRVDSWGVSTGQPNGGGSTSVTALNPSNLNIGETNNNTAAGILNANTAAAASRANASTAAGASNFGAIMGLVGALL